MMNMTKNLVTSDLNPLTIQFEFVIYLLSKTRIEQKKDHALQTKRDSCLYLGLSFSVKISEFYLVTRSV